MTRASYIGTHHSRLTHNQLRVPHKLLIQILSRERELPHFFYAFPLREGDLPYIYLLSPHDFQENQDQVNEWNDGKDISDQISRIEVRRDIVLTLPKKLKQYAELGREGFFIGFSDYHIELWSRTNLQAEAIKEHLTLYGKH